MMCDGQVDYRTQRLSVREVIQIFEFSETAADKHIVHIKKAHPELAAAMGDPMKIDGFGKAKVCTDLSTMLQIIGMLPSNDAVIKFRSKCSEDLVRQMKGDLTLIKQIEHNHAVLEETGGLHFYESQGPQPRSSAIDAALPNRESEAQREAHNDDAIETAEMIQFRLDERKRRLSLDESQEARIAVEFDDRHQMSVTTAEHKLEIHQVTVAQQLEFHKATVAHQMEMWRYEEAEAEHRMAENKQRMTMDAAAKKQQMSFDFETGIAGAMNDYTSAIVERKEALTALGVDSDRARLVLADAMLSYSPRKYCFSAAHADQQPGTMVAVVDDAQVDISAGYMEIVEILQRELCLPPDHASRLASGKNGAGAYIAKEFRNRYGEDATIPKSHKNLDAINRASAMRGEPARDGVNWYAREDWDWITASLRVWVKAREAELEQQREDTAERVAAKAKLALDLLKAKKARDIERVKKQEDKASKLAEKEALIAAALHAASLQTPPKKQRTLMQYNMFD
jgi:hypothetical protein